MHEGEKHETASRACSDVTEAEHQGAAGNRSCHAEPVGEPPHQHAAKCKTEHREGERQRCIGARDAEVDLHDRQHDRDGPHADGSDTAEHDGRGEPQPGEWRFDLGLDDRALQHFYGAFLRLRNRLLAQSSDLR